MDIKDKIYKVWKPKGKTDWTTVFDEYINK